MMEVVIPIIMGAIVLLFIVIKLIKKYQEDVEEESNTIVIINNTTTDTDETPVEEDNIEDTPDLPDVTEDDDTESDATGTDNTMTRNKKALLVGINIYDPSLGADLNGCVNDVENMRNILVNYYGFDIDNVRVLTDSRATKANILERLQWLLSNNTTGDELVFHYSGHGCFSGDTKIRLLDGTTKTMEQLEQNYKNKEFWVYSCTKDGEIVPGKAHSPRITKTSKVIKITLDNNKSITCTDDHLFMLRDGTYKMAKELDIGTSLMPLYTKLSDKPNGDRLEGYELVYIPNSNNIPTNIMYSNDNYFYTHQIVGYYSGQLSNGYKGVLHHKDFNKLNNIPSNLELMNRKQHSKLHAQTEEHKEKCRQQIINYNKNIFPKQISEDKEFRKKFGESSSKARKKDWQNENYRNKVIKGLKISYKNSDASDPRIQSLHDNRWKSHTVESREKAIKSFKKIACDKGSKLYKSNHSSIRRNVLIQANKKANHIRWHVNRNIIKDECVFCNTPIKNHKVVSIEYLNIEIPVYDITVEKYNNFALDAGVFVHNSQVRDRNGDELDDGLDEILCVDGKSIINTNIGLITAEKLYEKLKDNKKIQAKVGNDFFNISYANKSSKDKLFLIRTKSGMTHIVGEEHPIATLDKHNNISFIKAANISIGQSLLNSYGLFNSLSDNIKSDDLWYIVGLFIGDGYFASNKSVRFAYTSYTKDWYRELNECNIPDKHIKINKNNRGDTIAYFTSDKLCNLLKSMYFKPYSKKTGCMPDITLPMDPSCLKGFLQGIFDAEGSSSNKSNTIILTMKDLNIVNRIKIALDLFGIKSHITTNKHLYHTLTIHSSHANKFNEIIGFRFKDKNKTYTVDSNKINSGVVGNIDGTSIINLLNRWNFKKKDISLCMGINKRNHIRINKKKITEKQFLSLINLLSDRYNKLLRPINNRLEIGASANSVSEIVSENLWTTISKFRRNDYSSLYKYIDIQKQELSDAINKFTNILEHFIVDNVIDKKIIKQDTIMYDFTVDKCHMFECNNMLVHNCPHNLDWDDPLTDDIIGAAFDQLPEGIYLTMICDSCHSGTITRNLFGCNSNSQPRRIIPPFDIRARSLGKKIEKRMHMGMSKSGNQNHVLLSGCKDNQTSADAFINGKYQGALSWALTTTIKENPGANWITIHNIVVNKLSSYSQEPQLSGNSNLLNRTLFGGTIK